MPIRDLLAAAGAWAARPQALDVGIVVLAQATTGTDPLAQYTGYGALGLVVLGAITGQIRFKAEVVGLQRGWDEDRKRWDGKEARLQSQVEELVATYKDQALPALLASSEALRGSSDLAGTVKRIEGCVDHVLDLLRRQGG